MGALDAKAHGLFFFCRLFLRQLMAVSLITIDISLVNSEVLCSYFYTVFFVKAWPSLPLYKENMT